MAEYHIRIRGHLPDRYADWFEPLAITREPLGETLLAGELVDQGALFGVLLKIRDLGLSLLAVTPDPGWSELTAEPESRPAHVAWREGTRMSEQKREQQEQTGGGARFFDVHQRATVEAAMARIIPTDERPGAREANTVEFVDRYLSGIGFVYAKPDGSGFETLEGKRAAAWQRRIDSVRATYVAGVADLDARSRARFGGDFAALAEAQQDQILAEIERPAEWTEMNLELAQVTAGYGTPVEPALQQTSAEIDVPFFVLLCLHTRQGFYADPIYGGNRDRVGWQLIGFAGPESLAETHAGRFTTLPFFAEQPIDWGKEQSNGPEA